MQLLSLLSTLEDVYQDGSGDPPFTTVLAQVEVGDESALADLIEADGRLRLRLDLRVGLDRYLGAVPDLREQPDALDAAIDMALRSLAMTGRADSGSVNALVSQFPDLEEEIREAATLGNALCSTGHLREQLGSARKTLPVEFGPLLSDGTRRYELQELLGEGAFGQVYRAVDRQLSEPDHLAFVAIKVLASRDRDDWRRQQLIDEATKARRIDHPNVARVLDLGVSDEDEDFIVYEFVEGGDLGRWARRQRDALSVRDVARLTASVARGVHAAHMAGLVHCDLKPNNIVMTAAGTPRVVDFGIAIRADEAAEQAPRDRRDPLGNLAFMSPEQYRMEPGALNIPTDVYALGGILFWLITGVLPNGSTPEEIQRNHDPAGGRLAPPSLRRQQRDVDADLNSICKRAMALRPEERYHSAAGLAEDLEAWCRREPLRWTHPSIFRRLTLWARRNPALATSVAILAALAVGSAAALQRLAVQKAVAQARLEEEEQERKRAAADLKEFTDGLVEANKQGAVNQILVSTWAMEWLYGPTVLGDGPDRWRLWDLRIDVARDFVEKARAAGRTGNVEALLWQTSLGFWLVRRGRYGEADSVLAENERAWRSILAEHDPWILHLAALRVCSRVGLLASAESEGPAPDSAEVAALVATLEQADANLAEAELGSPIHRAVLDHLAIAHEQLRKDPDAASRIRAGIAELPD